MVERRGRDQRTCMNSPWTWTTVWALKVGGWVGLGRGGNTGTTVLDNNIKTKVFKKNG